MAQAQLRQKESELKQANAELEERGKLLYKTKVGRGCTRCVVHARRLHARSWPRACAAQCRRRWRATELLRNALPHVHMGRRWP